MTEKPSQHNEKINPVIIIGGMALKLSDILAMDTKPEVKTAIETWLAKKEKAFQKARRRKVRKKRRYK